MHAVLVSVLHLFLSRCDKKMQMQDNAAALARSKVEHLHLKNSAAGLFLLQHIQGPADIGHCAAQRLQNF